MPESVTDRPTRSHEYIFLLTKSARYFYDADAIREQAIHAGETVSLGPKSLSRGQATGMGREASGNGKADSVTVAAGRNRRSVWTVTTQPFPGAHFATFPPKLIEPCVLAGSPPKCCGECGAPWERLTETKVDESVPPARQNIHEPEVTKNGQGTNAKGSSTWGHYLTTETLGWQPTCDHHDDSGTATVLDPFAGAGTTGLVALRHNRSFIGIELNPDYCEMARNRIRDDAPLLNTGSELAA